MLFNTESLEKSNLGKWLRMHFKSLITIACEGITRQLVISSPNLALDDGLS